MAIPLSEIKKLSTREKYKLMEKISDSIDDDIIKTEENLIIEERLKLIDEGKMKFDTWDNAKKRIINKSIQRIQKG